MQGPPTPQVPASVPLAPPPQPRTFYQFTHSFATRCRLSAQLRGQHPGCVPVILEPVEHVASAAANNSSNQNSSNSNTATASASGPPSVSSASRGQDVARQRQRECEARWAAVASGVRAQQRSAALRLVMNGNRTLSDAILMLRERLTVESNQSLFLIVGAGEVMAAHGSGLQALYDKYKDADGFLYVAYMLENTFG